MSAVAERWRLALDEIDRDVAALDRALGADEVVEVPAWEPPAGLGPLPPELRTRAARTLQRLREVEARSRRRVAEFRRTDDELERRRRAGNAYAV